VISSRARARKRERVERDNDRKTRERRRKERTGERQHATHTNVQHIRRLVFPELLTAIARRVSLLEEKGSAEGEYVCECAINLRVRK
jgi:hypothetical protein